MRVQVKERKDAAVLLARSWIAWSDPDAVAPPGAHGAGGVPHEQWPPPRATAGWLQPQPHEPASLHHAHKEAAALAQGGVRWAPPPGAVLTFRTTTLRRFTPSNALALLRVEGTVTPRPGGWGC